MNLFLVGFKKALMFDEDPSLRIYIVQELDDSSRGLGIPSSSSRDPALPQLNRHMPAEDDFLSSDNDDIIFLNHKSAPDSVPRSFTTEFFPLDLWYREIPYVG